MVIEEKDRKNKYKRFKKCMDNKDAIIETDPINKLEAAFIKAFNEKEIKKRYEFIYDYMCKYLDNNVCVLCDFKNDKCIANRLGKSVHKENGCCYFRNEGFCILFKDKRCTNPNISCKLFMCEYVEKNIMKKKSLPKNYLLLDFFFNKKQKEILQRSYRKKKEETISKLLVNR